MLPPHKQDAIRLMIEELQHVHLQVDTAIIDETGRKDRPADLRRVEAYNAVGASLEIAKTLLAAIANDRLEAFTSGVLASKHDLVAAAPADPRNDDADLAC